MRSVMYRSFVTCDDPKGVVDCGKIRKSKNGSKKMEQKMKSRRTAKKVDTSLPNNAEKEEMIPNGFEDDSCDPSSLQLMEVSRGAQELNQSCFTSCKKLHSTWLVCRKEKNQKLERGRFDELMIERIHTNQVRGQNYPMGFQKPRLSADGSSRDCVEELKKVVRDSLVRQNLLPSTTAEEIDSALDFPSTSSSQSSIVYTDRLTDSSLSSTASQDKKKGPNIIAKLMGLEEVPSKPSQATLQKLMEGEKILNQRTPMFDIDKPQVRKSQFVGQRVNPEHKTLKEILGAMHFKGLLRNKSRKEPKLQIHHAYHSYSERLIDDAPPIVLIKPLYTPYLESEEPHAPVLPEEEALKSKYIVRKLKKEVVPPRRIKEEDVYMNSNGMHKKLEVEEALTRRLQEEGPYLKEIGKPDEKEVRPNYKALDKGKLSGQVSHKPQNNEIIDKKAKLKTTTRKPLDKEVKKVGNLSRSQDQVNITSTKLKKDESGSRTNKDETPQKQSTAASTISKNMTPKINNSKDSRNNQIKKRRPAGEPRAAKLVARKLGHQEHEKKIDLPCEDNSKEIRIITSVITLADQLSIEDEADISTNNNGANCEINQSPLVDVTLLNSKHGRDATPAEEACDHITCSTVDSTRVKYGSDLKYLLLNSQSFIIRAEELFNLYVDCPKSLQTSETNNYGIVNLRLYSECANELIERKSLQILHPLLVTSVGNSRLCISLDKLVEEICNSIQNLESYGKASWENLSVDSLYTIMDRDMMCKGLVQGIWDLGWRHGFSVDEVEQVVNDIEKQVLSGLIEEVIT
ncbi:DUF4378 domain-containing protein [Quillaja saponaria]|uniref:DUF4378 domain-containing protein n=1 Tax=Quillaja saponaria TaxID=32244 RepID=A0AAD7PWQ6_QUISA|nr:DUF4378 domain-containing protein [Quillaja saponaria]